MDKKKNQILLVNPDGSISHTFPQYDHFKSAGGGGMFVGNDDRYLFNFENEICFKDQYNDTLFVLSPEKLSPRYIFQLGKYGLPPE
ncbi:hypothetical protein AGMMS49574_06040 [Bacteroidia bacterium]|nr:hypothetical protein AGMMS49574_06040 [Bacteroidia bacterium]